MQRLSWFTCLLWVTFLLGASVPTLAQQECDGNLPDRADAMAQAIKQAKSCRAAAAIWRKCPFGASADVALTSYIINKCETLFLKQLSPAGKKRYDEEMQLCNYQYSQQDGTLWMSKAAGCQVNVAEHFAANPARASRPGPRASFGCEQARSVLKKAICSDIRLGHADIVLSRVFTEALNSNKKNRLALLEDDKKWRQSLVAKCRISSSSLPLREDSLNCIRKEFEERFTAFNWCLEGIEGNDCSPSRGDENPQDSSATAAANARASFDCEKASTAMETVICADAEVGQADIKLAQAYHDAALAMPEQHQDLVESQRQWLGFVNAKCPMANDLTPSRRTRFCVRSAFETRTSQLQMCATKEPQERLSCLNDFQLFGRN